MLCRRPAPTSAAFAGGQPAPTHSAPANVLSQEEDEYRRAQLRREGHSPEESTSSYKGLLRRSRREEGIRSSDEPLFAGGQPAPTHSAPASILSQEEDEYRKAQLRREGRSPEEGTSSYKGLLRRSSCEAGIRSSAESLFAGGQHPVTCSAPANVLSQEEDEYRKAQLRREGRSPEESTSSYKGLLRRR